MFELPGKYHDILFNILGQDTSVTDLRLVASGSFNQAIYLETNRGEFLLKTNFDPRADIFLLEAQGLDLLRQHTPLKVPEVFGHGASADEHYLLMQWLPNRRPSKNYSIALGQGLAQLHMATTSQFGLDADNYIASLAQKNVQTQSWADFFIQNRLEPMAGKAFYDGLISADFLKRFRQIYPLLPDIFPKEKPALLHGDLWSGNVLTDGDGLPALIDPAVYYGHREVDLAFSKLFGGFEAGFYEAYQDVFPLEPGFESRVPVYNLYPLLVHLNLFGSSYLPPIERTVSHLLG